MATAILQGRHTAIVVAPEHHGFAADSARKKLVARNLTRPSNDVPSIQDKCHGTLHYVDFHILLWSIVASQCARSGRGGTASKFDKALDPDREPYLVMVAKRLGGKFETKHS
jgi:hypothetical protein